MTQKRSNPIKKRKKKLNRVKKLIYWKRFETPTIRTNEKRPLRAPRVVLNNYLVF